VKADMSKVPWAPDETRAIEDLVDIYGNVQAQLGPGDEDPGVIDFDDGVEIATKSFSNASALQRYIFAGRTTRERLERTLYVVMGAIRAVDVITPDPPRPGIGRSSSE